MLKAPSAKFEKFWNYCHNKKKS